MKQELTYNKLDFNHLEIRNLFKGELILIDKSCIGDCDEVGDIYSYILAITTEPEKENSAFCDEKFHTNAFIIMVRNTVWIRTYLQEAFDLLKKLSSLRTQELINF